MAKKKKETKEEESLQQETPVAEAAPEVNPWEEKYNAEHDSYLRLAADYDNYRKRTLKEKDQAYGNGLGVEIFGNEGDTFDPNIHNAIMHTEAEGTEENTITKVFQKGFKLGEKIVRFAMVEVAN